jgi:hypothetical protein
MNRKAKIFVAIFVLLGGTAGLSGHGPEPKKVSDLMKKKLEHAQKVLEGVAIGDFDMITDHARELMVISKAAEWKGIKSPRYEVQLNQFRRSVDDLIEKAREKNLDGAALSYVEMTLSCVKCHKHVREVRTTRLDRVLEKPLLLEP